ncbi:MAG: hypothetical protein Q7S22_06545 [Candidatus Micrarchaeota archaeon]|nr:hypothetical protein [Candidatus Micrarchaeota archaeon]
MELPNIYNGNYKLLIILPLILIVASLLLLPNIKLGVEFRGGTLITLSIDQKMDPKVIEQNLKLEGIDAKVDIIETTLGYKAEINVPQNEKLVTADELKEQFTVKIINATQLLIEEQDKNITTGGYYNAKTELDNISNQMFLLAGRSQNAATITDLNQFEKEFYIAYNEIYKNYRLSIEIPINKHLTYSSISIETVSPSLSKKFISGATTVMLLSAILSTIFVFIFMRAPIPSLAVVIGAASDVLIALGAMGLFGIPLTLPSFAALLMLVGFSLDTDILLTTRMLTKSGNPREKAFDSMKTGMTMTSSAIVAFLVLFALATFTGINTYYEISAVALAGLLGDLFATWGINGVLMLWYVEKKEVA